MKRNFSIGILLRSISHMTLGSLAEKMLDYATESTDLQLLSLGALKRGSNALPECRIPCGFEFSFARSLHAFVLYRGICGG